MPHKDRIGTVLPTTVVRDDDGLVALYLAPGTRCMRRLGKRDGQRGRVLVEDTGKHEEWVWKDNRRLILWRPHAHHAVSLFWRQIDGAFLGWYVDILEPFRRTPLGFDTRDLVLDVVVDPDGTWRWKDEDELAWRVDHGLLTPAEARSIMGEADRVTALLEAGDPLFGDGWTSWLPEPDWTVPHLIGGWDMAQRA